MDSFVIVRYEVYGPGVANLHCSKNVRFYNSTIRTHPGMGIHGSDSENILIDGLKIIPPEGLWMSATADGTHFNYCRGTIDILNSHFEKMGDDATNVHQMYWMLTEKVSPTKIVIEWGKKRDGGNFPTSYLPHLGDEIAFGAEKNWLRLEALSKVTNVEIDKEKKLATISLESPLPDYVKAGMPMANMSSDPKLTIKNCTVKGNRARGFLIKVSNALIENCYFERPTGAGVLMENDANFWYEGFRTQNVKIKNCKFVSCNNRANSGRGGAAILDAAAFSKNMPNEGPVNGTTIVENCEFIDCFEEPINLKQTQNPILKNNIF